MVSFKAETKAEAARQLAVINDEIIAESSQLNKMKILPLLLCLEDAVNSAESDLARIHYVDKVFQDNPDVFMASVQFIYEWYFLLNRMTDVVVTHGFYDASTKIEISGFGFGFVLNDDLPGYLDKLHKQGSIESKAIIVHKPRLFMNKIKGHYFFNLEPNVSRHIQKNLHKILALRDLLYQKGLLEAMVYLLPAGAKVEFDETGMRRITYPPGVTYQSVYEKLGITPSVIETYGSVYDWNSKFREVGVNNIKSHLQKGKENREQLKNESEQIYKAYCSMPKFEETFGTLYDLDVRVFSEIVQELKGLCYDNLHTVGIWKDRQLLNSLQRFNSQDVLKTIELLGNNDKKWGSHSGLVCFDEYTLTNFRRLSVSELALLQNCFNEAYDNDLKGVAFEEASRRLLSDNQIMTVKNRIDIFEPMLPDEVANAIWGRQKYRTDIDVLGSFNKSYIIMLECKEIKSRIPKVHEENQFRKYVIESSYKAKWISQNIDRFKGYVGENSWKSLNIDETRPIRIIPLVVSNNFVTIHDIKQAALVTFQELKNILSKDLSIKSNDEAGVLEIETDSRKISLLWVSTQISP